MKLSISLVAAGALIIAAILLLELALAVGPRITVEVAAGMVGVALIVFGFTRNAD